MEQFFTYEMLLTDSEDALAYLYKHRYRSWESYRNFIKSRMESLIYSTDRELTGLNLEELVDSRLPILGHKLQQEMIKQLQFGCFHVVVARANIHSSLGPTDMRGHLVRRAAEFAHPGQPKAFK